MTGSAARVWLRVSRSVAPVCVEACIALQPGIAESETHHVDCALEPDAVRRINATEYEPGDRLLLKRGTECSGGLRPQGSGAPGRPITLGAYGEGPLPVVNAGSDPAALALFNQRHWHIERLELIGGSPYGIHISGDRGVLRHFRIRNVEVHGVTGEPKHKSSGLVVIAAGGTEQTFEDVVIDGVTAHDSTQWAGIIVNGSAASDPAIRAKDVTVRNSIVHSVYGDGIVLFQVEDGLIERSAVWLTGLQPKETIGTPNGIWTWRCRRCVVQYNEGFFIDSPGIDGGVFDIDWGNDDSIVQYNYGHDAMGYCAAVFGAHDEVTTNSVVRHNVCANNGRSPKLALRQGDIYLATWQGGALDGVSIMGNTIYWNPLNDVPALRAGHAEFRGDAPRRFHDNRIFTDVGAPLDAGQHLDVSGNTIQARASTTYPTGADWTLLAVLNGSNEARSTAVVLQSAARQYAAAGLRVAVAWTSGPRNLAYDWSLDSFAQVPVPAGIAPTTTLLRTTEGVVHRWTGTVPPAELGMALRRALGPPRGAAPVYRSSPATPR